VFGQGSHAPDYVIVPGDFNPPGGNGHVVFIGHHVYARAVVALVFILGGDFLFLNEYTPAQGVYVVQPLLAKKPLHGQHCFTP
jgi:hypothetical protein